MNLEHMNLKFNLCCIISILFCGESFSERLTVCARERFPWIIHPSFHTESFCIVIDILIPETPKFWIH
ncbi:hypothetical protein KP509_26G009600 [Ceratopteris richardii]|uniref:Secreted protein n=1 Tax=Ceratopteris richardii TaxID=49495 RepID=A0A8T2RHY8_CERRI|nr:hypothetical protein KP509_26G009600 [Ceratopteris richardii]